MDAATLAVAMGCARPVAERHVAAFNSAMAAAGCTTQNRAAMWCAQIGHESLGLRYMEELASGSAYEGRRDLGNLSPGDGRRYKGRGPIQITGRTNYGKVSQWAHAKGLVPSATYFLDQPGELASDKFGFIGPVWYWTIARPQINPLCDQGAVTAVTRLINGGTNGLADRAARWQRCLALGDRLLPSATATSAAHVPTATAVASPPTVTPPHILQEP